MYMYNFLLGIVQLCDQTTCNKWVGVFLYVDGIDKLNKDELEICMFLILMLVWCSHHLIKTNYMLTCHDLSWIYSSSPVLSPHLSPTAKYIIRFWLKPNVRGQNSWQHFVHINQLLYAVHEKNLRLISSI